MEGIHFLIVGIIGMCLGSFSSVLVTRIPLGESIVFGRSKCCHCTRVLTWSELIPVFSFLLQGARCKTCKVSISWEYPTREILLGGICVWILGVEGWSLGFVKYSILAVLLLAISEIDYRHGIIPNKLIIAGGALGFLLLSLAGLEAIMSATLASITVVVLPLVVRKGSELIFGRVGLGMGDVKLIAMIAFFTGWHSMWAFYLATLIGGVAGLYGISTGRFNRTTRIPFAPFIALGVVSGAFIYPLDVLSWFI